MRVLIVGGSLGGLFAANMLHRAGCEVRIFERVTTTLSGRGAGIATHPELFEALRRAGAVLDESVGVTVAGRAVIAPDGRIVGTYALPQVLTAWSRLHRLLADALPPGRYHAGKELTSLQQDEDAVRAHFADGTTAAGDLLVGADGFRSTVRGLLDPDTTPAYAGYAAWRGLIDEATLSTTVRDALFDYLAFCLLPGEQMLGYPVAGADDTVAPGERRYNFVWYRPADEKTELRRLMTDDDGRFYPEGIAPHLVSRRAIDAAMRADAARLLPPQFVEVVERTAQPFIQPIMDLASARMVFGRVALLGDAAFVARPHVGMGVTKAGADAMALVDAMTAHRGSLEAALAQYQATRLRVGRFIVEHGRYLGLPLNPRHETAEERRLAQVNGTPDFVMRTAAVAPPPPWQDAER